jgi:hypothetical protein
VESIRSVDTYDRPLGTAIEAGEQHIPPDRLLPEGVRIASGCDMRDPQGLIVNLSISQRDSIKIAKSTLPVRYISRSNNA